MVPALKECTLYIQIYFVGHLKIYAHLESLHPIMTGTRRKVDRSHIKYNTALTFTRQYVTWVINSNSFQELRI